MGRIIAIDYGLKRTGLAVTDPLQIIATPLEVVVTSQVISFLKSYLGKENVDEIVVGMPKQLNNKDSQIAPEVRRFIEKVKQEFPNVKISEVDERFTSRIAQQTMITGGMKKKDRRVKGNVDKISATLILQTYMQGKR